jgi:hypothetical protein
MKVHRNNNLSFGLELETDGTDGTKGTDETSGT